MKNILVSDIMTRDPEVIKPETDLLECAKKMVKKRVGSLLIIDKKKLVGFLDERDILWALVKKSKQDLSKIKAIDISPRKIATVRPDVGIDEAMKKMKKFKFKKLPVILNNELVGMITIKDILNFHPEFYPELEELAKIREQTKKLKRVKSREAKSMVEGVCEECGNQELLYRSHGMLVCGSCRDGLE